jgi:hypothetical protein|tara:strand:+ start:641 stop:832 length:192 start_codon:yes stop_codon:yes gene_type:complete
MPRVAPEDSQMIAHINYTCENIHQFGDDFYEDMMERDYDKAQDKCLKLIKVLKDMIESMEDEL